MERDTAMQWTQVIAGVVGLVTLIAVVVRVGMMLGRIESTLNDISDELRDMGSDNRALAERVRKLENDSARPARLRR